MKLYKVSGGGYLMNNFVDYDDSRVIITAFNSTIFNASKKLNKVAHILKTINNKQQPILMYGISITI